MKKILQNKKYDEFKKLFSILVTIGFAIYNFLIGIIYNTNWNLIISIYYFLLLCIKFLLVTFIFKLKDKTKENIKKERIVYCFSFAFLILINLALIGPAILLIENKKEVRVDRTTSVLIATYAFINIVVSLKNLRKNENDLLKNNLIL